MMKLFKNKKHKRKRKRTFTELTYTKVWISRILWTALIDIQLSYILAFLGRDQIAEQLSIAAVSTVLGVTIPYLLKSFFGKREEEKNKLIREEREMFKFVGNREDDGTNEEESMR